MKGAMNPRMYLHCIFTTLGNNGDAANDRENALRVADLANNAAPGYLMVRLKSGVQDQLVQNGGEDERCL
jgi:hypothetical protein